MNCNDLITLACLVVSVSIMCRLFLFVVGAVMVLAGMWGVIRYGR